MAEPIRVTLDLSGFGDFEHAALDAIEKAVEAAAEQVVAEARPAAPYLTGFLHDHILPRQIDAFNWDVDSEADYSAVNEFGGQGRPARPYFTPAVEAERARFAERIAKALAEAQKG